MILILSRTHARKSMRNYRGNVKTSNSKVYNTLLSDMIGTFKLNV